jgi:TRAP-type C4-dicarboxylate transport system permease large subunit
MKEFFRSTAFARMIADLGATKPTIVSKIITYIGTAAALIVAIYISKYQGSANQSFVSGKVAAISLLLVLASIVVLGARRLAIAKDGTATARSVGGVFKRLFLWMFLPAIILTIVLTGVAFLLGTFNR